MALLGAITGEDGRIVDFRWLMVNEEGGRLLDRPTADLIGMPLLATLPPGSDTRLLTRLTAVAETGAAARFEASCGGTVGLLECSAVPASDGVALTFRRSARDPACHTLADDHGADRAKATFLALMSHEIRTPLNGVVCALDLLADGASREDRDYFLETARNSGRALAQVVDEILNFTKLETGPVELRNSRFELADLIATEVERVAPAARAKNLRVSFRIDPDLPRALHGDRQKLARIVRNLLENAVKFTDQGGVSAVVERVGVARDHLTSFVIAVNDTGIGIHPDYQANVFDAFSQEDSSAHRRHGGCGLGLAIASRLAAALGGELTWTSVPCQGSSFRLHLSLPSADASKPENDQAIEDQAAEDQVTGTRPSALLADAGEASKLVTRLMLMRAGYHVRTVTSGADAIEAVRRQPFDVVLLDTTMPDMSGPSVASAIRALGCAPSTMPIVGMTTHADLAEKLLWLEAGSTGLLVKPFQKRDLIDVLAGCPPLAAE
jgi:signal transduction histidine kinase/CheY-like chemotaxis protein